MVLRNCWCYLIVKRSNKTSEGQNSINTKWTTIWINITPGENARILEFVKDSFQTLSSKKFQTNC